MKKHLSNKAVAFDFPEDIRAATHLRLEINDVRSTMTMMDSNSHRPSKKYNSEKLTRFTEINLTFARPVHFAHTRLSMDGRSIEIHGRPESALLLPNSLLTPDEIEVVTYYNRNAKRKVLSAFYLQNERPPATVHRLLERYDHFYAIDTNTVDFKNFGSISFTTVIKAVTRDIGGGYGNFRSEIIYQDFRRDVKGNPEISAWQVLVSKILAARDVFRGKIGIIVDSELGRIKDINLRRVPLFNDSYLPQNFELIFASDSSGNEEYFANKIIRECDANSTRMLKQIGEKNGLVRLL